MATRNYRQHRRDENDAPQDRYIVLRQWLNLLFMVGAVAGLAVYFTKSTQVGTYIILFSMVLKIVECVLRLLK